MTHRHVCLQGLQQQGDFSFPFRRSMKVLHETANDDLRLGGVGGECS